MNIDKAFEKTINKIDEILKSLDEQIKNKKNEEKLLFLNEEDYNLFIKYMITDYYHRKRLSTEKDYIVIDKNSFKDIRTARTVRFNKKMLIFK